MDKFTLNRRNITVIASYLFLTAIFFTLGLFVGLLNREDTVSKSTSATVRVSPDVTQTPVATQNPSCYRVILEDGELRLYLDENGVSRLISSEEISEDLYPASDIATLKEGVTFDTSDGAISLMENFTS